MGFSKLKTAAVPAAKVEPPKTVVVEREVYTPPPAPVKTVAEHVETAHALATVTERGMAAFDGGSMGKNVLAAIASVDERSLLFPILALSGGSSGGAFAPIKAVPEEIANQMPQGKKPFEGFVLGYRTEIVAWPAGFDDREEGSKPSWSVAISSEDAAGAELVKKACKQYQFTKNDAKGKFDFADSGVGHIKPVLQLLVWLPDVEDLIIVQTPAHFESWRKTAEQLNRNADPKTGEVLKFPALIRPVSTPKNINGFATTEHIIDITAMLNDAGAKLFGRFSAWREGAKQNPEIVANVGSWVQGLDAPRTDEINAILQKAAKL